MELTLTFTRPHGETLVSVARDGAPAVPALSCPAWPAHAEALRKRAQARYERSGPASAYSHTPPRDLRREGQEVGEALWALLPEDARTNVADWLREADATAGLHTLAVVADEALGPEVQALPWELLRPGEAALPLCLHPRLSLVRRTGDVKPTRTPPGPLRVLMMVAAPEADDASAPALDCEREEGVLLDALAPALGEERVLFEVAEEGNLKALDEALARGRFQVLHLTGHGRPGSLLLEDEDGGPHDVEADALVACLCSHADLRLVILSECYSAALALHLARYVPYVIGMSGPVPDDGATSFAREFFSAVGAHQPLEVAFLRARAALHQWVLDREPLLPGAPRHTTALEYSLPVLYAPRRPVSLLNEETYPIPDRRNPIGVDLPFFRGIGEMVGRRYELRRVVTQLGRSGGVHQLVGIGGIGKSSLSGYAAERLLRREWRIAYLQGATSAVSLVQKMETLGRVEPPTEPLELGPRLARALHPFAHQNALLILDNFEDNLDGAPGPDTPLDATHIGKRFQLLSPDLRYVLQQIALERNGLRLLLTSRVPVQLEADAPDPFPVPPLGAGDFRKLMLRLGHVWRVIRDRDDIADLWRTLGGHPRALEFFDALLGAGQARFDDVRARLLDRLAAQGLTLEGVQARLEAARQAALTGGLAAGGEAQARAAQMEALQLAAADAAARGLLDVFAAEREEVGLRLLACLSVLRDPFPERAVLLAAAHSAPLLSEADARQTVNAAARLGLISRHETAAGESLWFLHQLAAADLRQRPPLAPELTAGHAAAAAYYDWLTDHYSTLDLLLEWRYHLLRAGDVAGAAGATTTLVNRLFLWGLFSQARALAREALDSLRDRPRDPTTDDARATMNYHLATIEHAQGNPTAARQLLRQASVTYRGLGRRREEGVCLHELARIEASQGNPGEARRLLGESLAITRELGDRRGEGASLAMLGQYFLSSDPLVGLAMLGRSVWILTSIGAHADVAAAKGVLDACEDNVREGLQRAEQEGHAAAATVAYYLGAIDLVTGLRDLDEAAARLERARGELTRASDDGAAACTLALACAYQRLGREADAAPLLVEAKQGFTDLGKADAFEPMRLMFSGEGVLIPGQEGPPAP